ncbi:MAG: type III-B CRISPR module RAMP protein Cmr6 [Pseudomonadota bacterium]
MEHSKTDAFRPVCPTVNKAVGELPHGAFNFGLYFQKWFYVVDQAVGDRWKRPQPWTCSLLDETMLVDPRSRGQDFCRPNVQLDNMPVSLALFNGESEYRRDFPTRVRDQYKIQPGQQIVRTTWSRSTAQEALKRKHGALNGCAEAFEKLGYKCIESAVPMRSGLIVGLGNEHPSEKGFRFDWTLGVPMIPSSGIKGVVRLATLVNLLNDLEEDEAREFCWRIEKEKTLPPEMSRLYGAGGDDTACRGKVIFLDAYPEKLPRLKAEIMNCHYKDYYCQGDKQRGPTEDQKPNPQKFWAVDPFLKNGEAVKFVFRVFLHRDISDDQDMMKLFERSFEAALAEHGLGAKTAIGHGRFGVTVAPPTLEAKKKPPSQQPVVETWEGAVLSWTPNDQTVHAEYGPKKAAGKGKEHVPESLRGKLIEKKKRLTNIRVVVEPTGGTNYKIIKIDV